MSYSSQTRVIVACMVLVGALALFEEARLFDPNRQAKLDAERTEEVRLFFEATDKIAQDYDSEGKRKKRP
jgi:hypothetical protein